jgi:hypothetical protein
MNPGISVGCWLAIVALLSVAEVADCVGGNRIESSRLGAVEG